MILVTGLFDLADRSPENGECGWDRVDFFLAHWVSMALYGECRVIRHLPTARVGCAVALMGAKHAHAGAAALTDRLNCAPPPTLSRFGH